MIVRNGIDRFLLKVFQFRRNDKVWIFLGAVLAIDQILTKFKLNCGIQGVGSYLQ